MFASFRTLDWQRFVLAMSFGYILSIFPLLVYFWRATMVDAPNVMTFVLFRADVFLVFSIVAFSSVGSLLSNSDSIDLPTVLACSANVIFGVLMFGCFSEFERFDASDPTTVQNIVSFGGWCWLISFLIFSFSHLRTNGEQQ